MRPQLVLKCQERWWLWNAWSQRRGWRFVSPALLAGANRFERVALSTDTLMVQKKVVWPRVSAHRPLRSDVVYLVLAGRVIFARAARMDAGSLAALSGRDYTGHYIKGRVHRMD